MNNTWMYSSVRKLLAELIDYAGLFPPASLPLSVAVANFKQYRQSDFGWVLGRFVVPASRLAELGPSSMPISVLAGKNLARDLELVRDFQRHPSGPIQAIEVQAATVDDIRQASEKVPSEIPIFFEVPAGVGLPMLLIAIAEQGGCAKIRTGGITADAFPDTSELVRFLQFSAVYGVPFKATAGLHHPLRGLHALRSEDQSPAAMMHGFLNLFVAAAFVRNHLEANAVAQLLEEQSPGALRFDETGVRWRDHRLTTEQISATRDQFAVSFGSCSVQEPIDDLKALGLL